MLYLVVQLRNVSGAPVSVDFNQATYDFEYEIDGTWYAFERMAPVRTTLTVMYSETFRQSRPLQVIAPGSTGFTVLTLPLAGRSHALHLYAITQSGPGRQFDPTPGPHVIRIRPGRALEGSRQPVSKAVTVTLRIPAQIDTRSQSVSFAASQDSALREFRFVSGPADGQSFIREVLTRPPTPASAPRLITSASLEIVEPLPFYELVLPRKPNAPDPSLPTTTNAYHYIVRASGQSVGTIGLISYPSGPALNWVGPATITEPVFSALEQLVAMEQVRGGSYEPRLVRVTGVRGTLPLLAVWLRSSSGRPDLFYRVRDPDFRGPTSVELERVYNTQAFLTAARTLPLSPRHDESWAITTATACAKAEPGTTQGPLIYDLATAEVGLSDQGDHIVWFVYFPKRQAADAGAAFFVDDASGTCQRTMLGA
jgi:hypothetical protein